MKAIMMAAIAAFSAAVACAQAVSVVETEKVDPATSAKLQEFKKKVAAENPGLDVVRIEADVI